MKNQVVTYCWYVLDKRDFLERQKDNFSDHMEGGPKEKDMEWGNGNKGRDLGSHKWFGSSGSGNARRPGILKTWDGELIRPGYMCKRREKRGGTKRDIKLYFC